MSAHSAQGDRGQPSVPGEPAVVPIAKRPTAGYMLEQWTPTALGIIGAVCGWRFGYLHLLSVSWAPLFLDRILTFTAIVIGYLVAVVAILPAVEDKAIVKRFKDWGYFKILVGYFGSAIWFAFVLAGLSFAPGILSHRIHQIAVVDGIFSALWWFALGFVVAAVIRATRMLLFLLLAR